MESPQTPSKKMEGREAHPYPQASINGAERLRTNIYQILTIGVLYTLTSLIL